MIAGYGTPVNLIGSDVPENVPATTRGALRMPAALTGERRFGGDDHGLGEHRRDRRRGTCQQE
jgi:hypothetical protein